ncbi:transglutaminase domain-containing protein [Lacinutrix sp. Hel_I_90]|uniref:transglutaminase domain-containing protein n=1 Tax=Lacinutrix sp. Hel_I_90 TaxID=1249999 RepID=UPI0005CAC852|nr:transglutaminase domain-containing protein [Lacinutrix sp. Hel_I_90]
MFVKYLLSFLFLFSLGAQSQIGSVIGHKNNAIIQQSKTRKDRVTHNLVLEKLAYSITKGKESQVEKAQAIYLWITKNISYDHELRVNKKLQKEFYTSRENVIQKVLQRQKALCGGFAFLFEQLCEQAGIEAKTIHGFTKLAMAYDKPNHSWSAVRLDGKWHLLDITWSVSNGNPGNPDAYWYLTPPNTFIKSHYPEDINWTLLNKPPSLLDFIN